MDLYILHGDLETYDYRYFGAFSTLEKALNAAKATSKIYIKTKDDFEYVLSCNTNLATETNYWTGLLVEKPCIDNPEKDQEFEIWHNAKLKKYYLVGANDHTLI